MNTNNQLFLKGLQGYTRSDNAIANHEAMDTLYYWWWLFMRLSPVFWYAKQTGRTPADPKVAKTLEKCGDLFGQGFYKWWNVTGKYVFSEAKRPDTVRLIDLEESDNIELYEKSVIVEIPLTISKVTIIKRLNKLLSTRQANGEPLHPGRALDVLGASNAQLRLHTKRFNEQILTHEYWVMIYRLLYPKVEVWRIGDRLQVVPALTVRGVERFNYTGYRNNPFIKLHSVTGRHLYKAERMILNVERGSFPNFNKVELADGYAPFGKKHDKEYKAAVNDAADKPAAWTEWLNEQHVNDLIKHVIKVNRAEREYQLPDSLVRQRLPAFMAGRSDLLKR